MRAAEIKSYKTLGTGGIY